MLLVVEAVIVLVEEVLTVVDVKVTEVEVRNVDVSGLCPKVVGKTCMKFVQVVVLSVLVNVFEAVFV